jgi:thermolysin
MCSTTLLAAGPDAARSKLLSEPGISFYQNGETERIQYVSGRLTDPVAPGTEVAATFRFLEENKETFRMKNPSEEMKVRRLDVDHLGMRHVRMGQAYQGLPVIGGEMIAHYTSDGILKAINGTFIEEISLNPDPGIDATQAGQVARDDLESFFGDGRLETPELVVFPWEDQNYLAWRMFIFSESPMGNWEYFVDAKRGDVIFKANRIKDVEAIGTGTSVMGDARSHIDTDYDGSEYDMIDYTRQAGNDPHGHGGQMPDGNYIITHIASSSLPGTMATDPDNLWNDAAQASAVDGHVYTALVYDWLLAEFGRNSFDDAGASMIVSVDYNAEGDNNAYWNGYQMVVWSYGPGWRSLAGCPDVIAHEWGHAVTDNTSNLIYQKESGALNESFSDMMGAAFEFAHPGYDSPDWLMGENGTVSGTGFRSMSNPTAYNDPDTYGGSYWVDVIYCFPSDQNDYCGVHTNSGVGNKWFYLLSDGGTHNGVIVTGIGVENAMQIAYRSNSFYWSSSTNYSEAAYATISAAHDLDGSGVWAAEAANAWEAVGVAMPAPTLVFSYPSGTPSLLEPAVETTFEVDVSATYDGSVVSGSGALHYRIDSGPIETVSMVELSPNHYQATLPALNCAQNIRYMVEAYETTSGQFLDPGPNQWLLASPGTDQITVFEDDFETDKAWVFAADWDRGTPTGGGGEYGGPDPTFAYSGTNIYGYNLSGDYPNNLSQRHLTSPAIDCSGLSNVHVNFQRWLGVESPAYDHAYIKVSNNGGTWTTVWENETEITDDFWVPMDVDISSVAANRSTVFIRFTMGTTDGGWRYCGWNIDNVQVTAYECNGFIDDADADGVADQIDNCPDDYNPDQVDIDGDDVGVACDVCFGYDDALDGDGDTVPDGCDVCVGYDDALDEDSDTVPDGCDNCPSVANPGQEDVNGDEIGDACCCEGIVGDANADGTYEPTIGDVTLLIDHLFINNEPLDCYTESDVNQSGGTSPIPDDITIGDVTALIDYLFIAGESATLPDCL